jgi:hypothetical protein
MPGMHAGELLYRMQVGKDHGHWYNIHVATRLNFAH